MRIDWLEKNSASIEATQFRDADGELKDGFIVTDFSPNAPFVAESLRDAIDLALESPNDEAERRAQGGAE